MKNRSDWLKHVALGAASGFVGTLTIQALLSANQKWLPDALPPLRKDPGEFMVERAEEVLPEEIQSQVPDLLETGAARALALGYGLTFGVLYAALCPTGGPPVRDGFALGLANWAVGYLGWLPALELMSPVWQQEPQQVFAPVAEHVIYGMTTVAAYDWLVEHI